MAPSRYIRGLHGLSRWLGDPVAQLSREIAITEGCLLDGHLVLTK
jgi:hypothetical protein